MSDNDNNFFVYFASWHISTILCIYFSALNKGKFEHEEIEEAKRDLGMPDIPLEVYPRPQAIPSDR